MNDKIGALLVEINVDWLVHNSLSVLYAVFDAVDCLPLSWITHKWSAVSNYLHQNES